MAQAPAVPKRLPPPPPKSSPARTLSSGAHTTLTTSPTPPQQAIDSTTISPAITDATTSHILRPAAALAPPPVHRPPAIEPRASHQTPQVQAPMAALDHSAPATHRPSAEAAAPPQRVVGSDAAGGGQRSFARRPSTMNPERAPLPVLQSSSPAPMMPHSNEGTVAWRGHGAEHEEHRPSMRRVPLPSNQLAATDGPPHAHPHASPNPPPQEANAAGASTAVQHLPLPQRDSQDLPGKAQERVSTCITVVFKGFPAEGCTGLVLPSSRIVEVTVSENSQVSHAVQRCLSMIDPDSLISSNLRICGATMEQRNTILPDSAVLSKVSRFGELYFLLIEYAAREPLTTTAHPDGSRKQSLTLLEQRLAALESFVRANSSPRRDEHHNNYHGTSDRVTSSSKVFPSNDLSIPEMSPILQHPVTEDLTRLLDNPRSSDRLHPATGVESYTTKADKLAFLALTHRERLDRLDETKQAISKLLELYQWMSQHARPQRGGDHPEGDAHQVQDRPALPEKVPSSTGCPLFPSQSAEQHLKMPTDIPMPEVFRQRGTDGATSVVYRHKSSSDPVSMFHAPAATSRGVSPPAVDHDNVHIDYDPVLDIWKLRKGPPM